MTGKPKGSVDGVEGTMMIASLGSLFGFQMTTKLYCSIASQPVFLFVKGLACKTSSTVRLLDCTQLKSLDNMGIVMLPDPSSLVKGLVPQTSEALKSFGVLN